MIKKSIFSLIIFLACAASGFAQEFKVDGLELPADQTVNYDEGFINIQAKCDGDVKWLVVSSLKVKYITIPTTNTIIVSIPPGGGQIAVFAVGSIKGKLTDFAKTNIQIKIPGSDPIPNPPPNPIPNPTPNPIPGAALHITLLVDTNNVSPEMALVLNSQNLRNAVSSKGNFFRLYDINSPIVAQKKLDTVAKTVGGSYVYIVQRNDGTVVARGVIPNTEAQAIAVINKALGN